MLLKITESCQMGCIHCSDSCEPDGKHMDYDTFKKLVDFIKELNPLTLIVSGGEPLDHPFFFEFMEYLLKETREMVLSVIVTSNGMFLSDEEKTKRALALGLDYQITNDERYYPKRINLISHPKLMYEHNIRHVVSVGRARENGLEHGVRNGMKCFNLRVMTMQMPSLHDAIRYLAVAGKGYCVPMIDVEGNVKPGEFTTCKTVGTIWEPLTSIYEKIKSMKYDECNACGDRKYVAKDVEGLFRRMENK